MRTTSNRQQVYDSATLKFPILSSFLEVFRFRDLIRNLIWRDLIVRYKRSVIGIGWVMINPLLTMGIMVVVFSTAFKTQVSHYPTYVLTGLILWNLFSQGTLASANSMFQNGYIIKRIYVPPSAFVFAGVGSALLNLAFTIIPFTFLALIDGVTVHLTWLYIVVSSLQLTIFTAGVSLIIATSGVFFADTIEIYMVVVNAYMYATPIMYPVEVLPGGLQALEQFNPLYYILSTARMAIIDNILPTFETVLIGTIFAVGTFLIGWVLFARAQDQFAYYV